MGSSPIGITLIINDLDDIARLSRFFCPQFDHFCRKHLSARMKGKKYLIIGLVVGLAIGWALGFLRLPHIEKSDSFLLGFIAALAFVALALLLLAARNRNFLSGLTGKKTPTGDAGSTRAHTLVWGVLVGVLVLGGVAVGSAIHSRNESFQLQIQHQEKQLREMAALVSSMKQHDPAPLMRSILDDVAEELKRNPGRTLRDTTIARIAALSFTFQPYPLIEADSLSEQAYSPARGQLLQALILMNMDTGSFARIKRNTLFAGADLRGAKLTGTDLSGINLHGANLKDADLGGANLKGADLGDANLWGANLNRANLGQTDLKRADLRWAQLNEATLALATLNGANLTNAQLRKADLTDATFQWTQSTGALFNEANLTGVDCTGTNFTKANLNRANLDNTDLRRINLSEADLVGVQLNKALVDEKWPDKLKEWQPMGGKELQERFAVVTDTTDQWKRPLFRLRKI